MQAAECSVVRMLRGQNAPWSGCSLVRMFLGLDVPWSRCSMSPCPPCTLTEATSRVGLRGAREEALPSAVQFGLLLLPDGEIPGGARPPLPGAGGHQKVLPTSPSTQVEIIVYRVVFIWRPRCLILQLDVRRKPNHAMLYFKRRHSSNSQSRGYLAWNL